MSSSRPPKPPNKPAPLTYSPGRKRPSWSSDAIEPKPAVYPEIGSSPKVSPSDFPKASPSTRPPAKASERPSAHPTERPSGQSERGNARPSASPPSVRGKSNRPGSNRPSQPAAVKEDFFLEESECAWDIVSLGEVMLRLDPGAGRIATTRRFDVWEGGGEYNVARGLRRCFGKRAAILTALVDNSVGRLVEDLMLTGGVDVSGVLWWQDDGAGRTARNGLNFTERGFGPRSALGCSDRGNTAVSQLSVGDLDLDRILMRQTRVLHTGGIFAALGAETSDVAREAMTIARGFGARVSYDLNYRPSLWQHFGGPKRAQEVNRSLVENVDILFGNEEDFHLALGFSTGDGESFDVLNPMAYASMLRTVAEAYPNLRIIATSLRIATSASENKWGGLVYDTESDHIAFVPPEAIEIFDRVGGGDSFASGLLFGLLEGFSLEQSLSYAVAHGALAMSTPGDTSMATRREVERRVLGASSRIER